MKQGEKPAATEQKPNIVFILTDNLGYGELGVYGGGILRGAPTPRLDKLASEGLRLTNMNMEAQCTPSRSSILTGRFSMRSGTYAVPLGGVPEGLTQWEITIAQSLSNEGYATGMWGKWHLGSHDGRLPNDRGFDEWYGIPRTTDEARWPSSAGYSPQLVPMQKIMEGKKGEKSRAIKDYDLEQRRLMDAEITQALGRVHRAASQNGQAVLRLPGSHPATSAHTAESRLRRQNRQRRLGGHAGRDGL